MAQRDEGANETPPRAGDRSWSKGSQTLSKSDVDRLMDELCGRGLLPASMNSTAALNIHDHSRRHLNMSLDDGAGIALFVKQACGRVEASALTNEARIYRLLAATDESAANGAAFAEFLDFVSDQRILVLRYYREAENLWLYQRRRKEDSALLAQMVGNTLGRIHRATKLAQNEEKLFEGVPRLSGEVTHPIVPPRTPDLADDNPVHHLLRALESSEDLVHLVNCPVDRWPMECLIHRDLKWDNCLACLNGEDRVDQVRLIDWEHAGMGDPAWDLAALVSEILLLWFDGIRLQGPASPPAYINEALHALDSTPPPISDGIKAYLAAVGLAEADSGPFMRRTCRYLPARMVDTAFKLTWRKSHVPLASIGLLQLAANFAKSPECSYQLVAIG